MSQVLAKKIEHYTYRDYLKWPEEEHWELIEGTPYNMAPAPTRIHQQIAGELFVQIKNFLRNHPCQAYIAPFDVRLPEVGETDETAGTVVQPDIVVVCDENKLDEKGCRGAPDWIIEVLSPSTAAKDQIIKRDLYARHGVREYWLVHPVDRILMIYRYQAGFAAPEILATVGTTAVALFPELMIDWSIVFY